MRKTWMLMRRRGEKLESFVDEQGMAHYIINDTVELIMPQTEDVTVRMVHDAVSKA